MNDFDLVNEAALRDISYVCSLFPHYTIEGDYLKSGDIYGGEGSSFILDLAGEKPGRWKDFGSGEGGIGIIALIMKREGIRNGEALRKVAKEIGYALPERARKKKPHDAYHWQNELFDEKKTQNPTYQGDLWQEKPTYIFSFKDENGVELYQKWRWEIPGFKKEERYCHWGKDKNGKDRLYHNAKIQGQEIRRVLYNLPQILQADEGCAVFIVEGQKHADKLMELGLLATSLKDWKPSYNFAQYLQGKKAFIIPDLDDAGRKQAFVVAVQCKAAGIETKIVELDGLEKPGDDILDWLKKDGNTVEKLQELADTAPIFDIEQPTQNEETSQTTASQAAFTPENFTTQISLAEDFERQYKDWLRWDSQQGYWYLWTNDIWQAVNVEYTRSLCRPICKAASDRILQSETKGAARIAALIASNSYVNGVETLCRSNVFSCTLNTLRDEDSIWDQYPFLLGIPGGVVDLRTGQVQEARREYYMTKKCAVAPSEFADCPRWLQFLQESTGGDGYFISYLQTICGYFLTGDTSEHALFFIYGPGGNGKSVFLNILNFIVNAYAKTASMTSFIETKTEQHPTDLAMLRGARLVSVSETEKGKAWAEAKIKQLTGGDKISARFMRQDFFTFKPNFKILVIGNHKPAIQNLDDAMKRRLHLIPFMNKPKEPDPYLEDKLKEEAPGILRWMIDGCLLWQRDRLCMPDVVKDATEGYFEEEDSIGQWINECCYVGNAQAKSSALFESWAEFARKNGLSQAEIGTNKAFSAALEKRGYKKAKTRYGVVFDGIGIQTSEQENSRYPDY